jgi:hypothetical protein
MSVFSRIRFVPSFTRLEQRESPASLALDAIARDPQALSIESLARSNAKATALWASINGETLPGKATDPIWVGSLPLGVAAPSAVSSTLQGAYPSTLPTGGVAAESHAGTSPASHFHAANGSAELPAIAHDHDYAPPRRSAPVRVPVD